MTTPNDEDRHGGGGPVETDDRIGNDRQSITATAVLQGLNELHLADLRRSGLSDDTIAALGWRSLTAAARDIMGMAVGAGMLISYPGTDHVRLRVDDPRPGKNGAMRYATRPGDAPRLFIPPGLPTDWRADPTVEISITEGEKKAVAASQNGILTIALAGVWCHQSKRKPLPDFDGISWTGRRVNVIGDSDLRDNEHALKGLRGLRSDLCRRGAAVKLLVLPPNGESKVGLDDYLLTHSVEDLHSLLAIVETMKARATQTMLPSTPVVVSGSTMDRCTDLANASIFTRDFGDRVRFVNESAGGSELHGTWHVYDGRAWARDADSEVLRLATTCLQREYVQAKGADERTRKLVSGSLNERRRAAMLKYAASLKPIATTPGVFDRDPWALCVANGILNLRTSELRPHNPAEMHSRIIPIRYDPSTTCPRFERFLSEVFDGDHRVVAYLQRWIGYCLTGTTREQCFVIFVGDGSNGESTLQHVMRDVAGGYAQMAAFTTFCLDRFQRADQARDDLHRLRNGVRLVTACETNRGRRLDVALLKILTGSEPITARTQYSKNEEFTPVAKFTLAVNDLPIISDNSFATWRRIHVVRFPVRFEGNRTKDIYDELHSESEGILAWAVDGASSYMEMTDLWPPDAVTAAARAYRSDQDVTGQFLAECCVIDPGASSNAPEVYRRYVEWAERNHEYTVSGNAFGRELTKRGIQREPNKRPAVYTNLGLV